VQEACSGEHIKGTEAGLMLLARNPYRRIGGKAQGMIEYQ
jgi:hypothetical protein